LREEHKHTYRSFRSDAWALLQEGERSHWGVVFAMQHYGLPTLFLDWTERFACAVYFALTDWLTYLEAAIYILHPERLNQFVMGEYGVISLEHDSDHAALFDTSGWHPRMNRRDAPIETRTLAVRPTLLNPRMLAQRSMFTMGAEQYASLEEQ